MPTSMREPIAIVGSACRFPGDSDTPSKLWDLLQNPRDIVSDFPPDRLNLSAFYNRNGEYHGSTDVKGKSYLLSEGVGHFDPGFFNINPREAEALDPQQRLLLETVYEALESAGCPLDRIQGSQTSVYVGIMTADWNDIQVRDPETLPTYTATGTARSILSNRISYFFNCHGPSMTIDTACSSSLVALHQAVQSLRNGESPTAIVAGANLILEPWMFIAESQVHMLSPNSRSRMWDKSADGYARGEGTAAMLLKPLSKALSDGDHIEAIVRETGVNSDGRTTGITMPSSDAQAELIRKVYRNAGLDPVLDRPQYFECHGTGTLAGDPVEARAVKQALFDSSGFSGKPEDVLYTGSIKTVIGHTEGTAGLAGVLKATLALRRKIIPPNLHFKELNPAIRPVYDGLCVPIKPIPWPEPASGPRRASVNSFGFGGTNAHCILESFEPDMQDRIAPPRQLQDSEERFLGPLVFSAQSEASLKDIVRDFAKFIRDNPSLSLRDLSWVLDRRRSAMPVKAFFSGSTRKKVLDYMDRAATEFENGRGDELLHRYRLIYPAEVPGVLGVFTGQGAQWATMGTALIRQSRVFRESIRKQQASLESLPDGPSWSLEQELLAGPDKSRVGESAFSQPLCTALQVAMVDVMVAAGVHLDAVVGHSSGEMAAVYAAGIISAEDAIRIAYYRGVHSKLACGEGGKTGGMMAVGLSMELAREFCDREEFKGRITVAASNSGASVTLSGDLDAIQEAKVVLDKDKTFSRQLVVDKAYHSHHMIPCADAYLQSLKACKITVSKPRPNTTWVSSVRGDPDLVDENRLESLTGQYWVDNMVKPVLFSRALERSCWAAGPFELGVEIGANPALKGPTMQVFKSIMGHAIPYAGFMRRGDDEVEALAGAIGYIWQHLGPEYVDLEGLRKAFESEGQLSAPQMLKDIPKYSWNHTRPYWKESRISRQYRQGGSEAHELLGRRTADSLENEIRWRNIIRLNELPWLRGHEFQGQTLFPAGGYLSMAVEAAKIVAGKREICTIELQDFELPKACVLPESAEGIEMIFSLRIEDAVAKDTLRASFSCFTCHDEVAGAVERTCFGKLEVQFGHALDDELPSRVGSRPNLAPIDMDRFYENLQELGLNYQGLFRGLEVGGRMDTTSRVSGSWLDADLGREYVVHPAFLDNGFHAIFCAHASPATGEFWAPFLPVGVRRLTVNPNVKFNGEAGEIKFEAHACITESTQTTLSSEIHMYNANNGQCGVIVEGITVRAMYQADASNDRIRFIEDVWDQDLSSGLTLTQETETSQELAAIEAVERLSIFYRQTMLAAIKPEERAGLQKHMQLFLNSSEEFLRRVRNGEDPYCRSEWLQDDQEYIRSLQATFPDCIDIQISTAIGEVLPGVLRGEVHLLEVMLRDDMLSRFYTEGLGFGRLYKYIAGVVKQVTHRYPRPAILEIGAGTGGTTQSIFEAIGDKFSSYTYTDISAAFFEKASERFRKQSDKMIFKTLDIEKDTVDQGYQENVYDIIVAGNVLHATSKLNETLAHARKLLRPGGFLVLMETTGELSRHGFIMGGLPGWWLGADEGRTLMPGVSPTRWDELLQEEGFSGVEHVLYDTSDPSRHACSLLISQAIDETFDVVREPLTAGQSLESPLVLVGGKSLATSKLTREIKNTLSRHSQQLKIVDSVDVFMKQDVPPDASFIVLEELDRALLMPPVSTERMEVLQEIFASAKSILWVTSGRSNDSPQSNLMVAIGRTLRDEMPSLNIQFLDFAQKTGVNGLTCAETFLRLAFATGADFANHDALWTVEPEMIIDNGSLLLPRIKLNTEANERYNAFRRNIWKNVKTDRSCVKLGNVEGKLVLRENGPVPNNLHIKVAYSVALPCTGTEKHHLCLGELSNEGHMAITVTSAVASCVEVAEDGYYAIPEGQACDQNSLQAIADQLIASYITVNADATKGSVIVFEPPREIAEILRASTTFAKSRLYFASRSRDKLSSDYIFIHPRATRRTMQNKMPKHVAFSVDSTGSLENTTLNLSSLLGCPLLNLESLMKNAGPMQKLLETAATKALRQGYLQGNDTIQAAELNEMSSSSISSQKIVEWPRHGELKAATSPLNASTLFNDDKTYLLVGLTGDLGQSLCRYMVHNGARHIVLTSRNADTNAPWLQEMNSNGAHVSMRKMDVTDRTSVRSIVEELRSAMPPIAGVCNGAMILSDSTFENMSAESMNTTLRPKVDGTIYLNDLFSEPTLDFFVLFSSFGAVLGNPGQSNYNAANLFMTGLAGQRRHRGLAASIMNIGMVTDVGWVARQGLRIEGQMRTKFWVPLSEKDVRQMFAEAIIAGNPERPGLAQISMGVTPFLDSPDAVSRPQWYGNPRFSHMIQEAPLSKAKGFSSASKDNLLQQLEVAESETEAAEAVIAAFSAKLELTLQLSAGTVRRDIPLLDAGVDSLLAVEVRTWFLKEMHVDVPVLKVLSGITIAEICAEAASKFLASRMESGAKTAIKDESSTKAAPKDLAPKKSSSPEGKLQSGLPLPLPAKLDTSEAPTRSASVGSSAFDQSKPITRSATPLTEPDRDSKPPSEGHSPTEPRAAELASISFTRTELMSFAQSRLWFLREFLKDPTTYNVTMAYSIHGPIQVDRFKNAVGSVVARHEALRSCFYKEAYTGALIQGVRRNASAGFTQVDAIDASSEAEIIASYKERIWNIEEGDVFGTTLITHGKDRHTAVFGYHHIALDGASWAVILRDLKDYYDGKRLTPIRKQYIEFARSQRQAADDGHYKDDLDFWGKEHATLPESLPLLPFARVSTRKGMPGYDNHTVSHEISQELTNSIKQASRSCGVTPFHFHLAVVQVLFAKFAGTEDICLGVIDANRLDQTYANTVGFFLNLLPLRLQLSRGDVFADVAKRTMKKVYDGLSHSSVPFDLILDELSVPRSSAAPPMFQAAFNYRVGSMAEVPLGESTMKYDLLEDAKSPYDLTWGLGELTGGKVLLQITAREYLYTPFDTQCIMNAYTHLLEMFSKATSRRVADCTLHSRQDIQTALSLGRGPRASFEWPDTLSGRFEEICSRFPAATAIKDPSGSISYSQLNIKVNSIAASIATHDSKSGSRIAVLCQPSTPFIATLLAVLKLGLIYVPLDLSLPSARHATMVSACQPEIIVHDPTTLQAANILTKETGIALIDATTVSMANEPIQSRATPDAPAILLFTSGSTGTPKGIGLPQAGLVNYFAGMAKMLDLGQERVIQQSSFGFDMSLCSIFAALVNGGTLVMVPQELRGDLAGVAELIQKEDISFVFATPSEYLTMIHAGSQYLRQCTKWRYALTGGEKTTEQLIENMRLLHNDRLRFVNYYGPTEISVAASCQDIPINNLSTDESQTNVENSIGRALPNCSVYVLDENRQPVPCGYPGEICIGGPGIARGYWRLPGETQKKFPEDPFAAAEDRSHGWTRMYCTADKGKILPSGQIIYLGRLDGDTQVKLRGKLSSLPRI